jgi:hypothetical protein
MNIYIYILFLSIQKLIQHKKKQHQNDLYELSILNENSKMAKHYNMSYFYIQSSNHNTYFPCIKNKYSNIKKHIINNILNIIKYQINNKNKQSYYNLHSKQLEHICKNNLKHCRINSKKS